VLDSERFQALAKSGARRLGVLIEWVHPPILDVPSDSVQSDSVGSGLVYYAGMQTASDQIQARAHRIVLGIVTASLACLGAPALASAASISVAASPPRIHLGSIARINVTGVADAAGEDVSVYVEPFGEHCSTTASDEAEADGTEIINQLAPLGQFSMSGSAISTTKFSTADALSWPNGSNLVCAYVGPSGAPPSAVASTTITVLAPPRKKSHHKAGPPSFTQRAAKALERTLSAHYGINDETIECHRLTTARAKCYYEHGLTTADIEAGYTNGESGSAYVTFGRYGTDVRVIPNPHV
jgi:hypothetical protein